MCVLYEVFEAGGLYNLNIGLTVQAIQDLNGFSNAIIYGGMCRRYAKENSRPRDDDAISLPSPTDSAMGGIRMKMPTVILEDDQETMFRPSASIGTALTQSGFRVSCESDSEVSGADRSTHTCKNRMKPQHDVSHNYRDWHQRLLNHFSLHQAHSLGALIKDCDEPLESKKIAIFASTFNMGEKDVNESELVIVSYVMAHLYVQNNLT